MADGRVRFVRLLTSSKGSAGALQIASGAVLFRDTMAAWDWAVSSNIAPWGQASLFIRTRRLVRHLQVGEPWWVAWA